MSSTIESISTRKPIRSYVRRKGRLTLGQKKALQELWPKYGVTYDQSPLNALGLFLDERPIILEIGFGNGQNLINLALTNPTNGYIGVDVHQPGAGHLLLELNRLNITNVRVVLQDAVEAIAVRFGENSLHSVLAYFPDPWPKKRHHKRRLFNSDFIRQLARRLILHGTLHIATDWDNYARNILESIENEPLLKNVAGTLCYAERPKERSVTRYEARGVHLGYQVRDIFARRL